MKSFDEVIAAIQDYPMRRVAVAVAQDHTVLSAVEEARKQNIANYTLVGDKEDIMRIAEENAIEIDESSVINECNGMRAVSTAVQLLVEGHAEILMKGHIHTDDFLRGVVDKEHGLRAGVRMSHVFIVQDERMEKFLFITDSAMNIAPNLEEKAQILLNAIHVAHIFGVDEPKVGCLAAVELLNPKMPVTVEATCLAKMGDRGQFSPKAIIDGPFALDNAISEMAAKHKNIGGPVAGKADVLLVPNVEAGNIFVKSLVYYARMKLAGVLVGAKAPVVVTSRADSAESKLNSIACAVYMADVARELRLKVGKVHY